MHVPPAPVRASKAVRRAAAFVAVALGWTAIAAVAVPALIRALHARGRVRILGVVIDDRTPLADYLDAWADLTGWLTVVLAVVAIVSVYRRRIHEWLVREPAAGRATTLLVFVWLGLLAGTIHALIPVVRGEVAIGRLVENGVVWLMPLSALIGFAMLGMIFTLSLRILRARPGIAAGFAVPATVAVFVILRSAWPGIHSLAALLLATGLALLLGRVAGAHSRGFLRTVRWSTPALAMLVVVTATATTLRAAILERRAIAALPPASADVPSVLLLILDTVRARSLELYGYHRQTMPALARFASRGVVFDHAIATAPWTLPSHGSMFTGMHAHELSSGEMVTLDGRHRTVTETLAERGFATAGFTANLWQTTRAHGLGRGFHHYEDYRADAGTILALYPVMRHVALGIRWLTGRHEQLGRKSAADVNRALLDWIDRAGHGPFFAFVNYFDAHHPYEARAPFNEQFSERPPRHWLYTGQNRHYAEHEVAELRDAYDATLAYMDDQIDRLLAELDQRGLLDNMLVIVTSDHGEHFGEHGLMNHGNSLYMPVLHVPLAIVHPKRVPAGRRVAAPVSLRSIPATIVDLIGGEGGEPFPAASLASVWMNPETADPETVLAHAGLNDWSAPWDPVRRGTMVSITAGGMHYIVNGDGVEELYDLRADPDEERNLVDSAAAQAVLTRLREQLASAMTDTGNMPLARQ